MTAPTPTQAALVIQTAQAVSGQAQIAQHVSDTTTTLIQALWRQVNPYDKASVTNFRKAAGRIIIGSQRTVATGATASQLLQLKSLGIDQRVAVTIPDNVRGATATFGPKKVTVHSAKDATVEYQEPKNLDQPEKSDMVERAVTKAEAEPDRIFERPAETYRYQKSLGVDDEQANSAAEKRIASIVDGNLILAQRLAEQQTLSAVRDLDKRVHGYRRVIHPELSKGGVCGLCVAAASRRYYLSELKPIHGRCNCTIAPITDKHDIGDILNTDDLSQLYDDAGNSTSGKNLKRVRYELVDHNELGPVLVRTNGEKVPYYSTERPGPAAKPAESQSDVAKRLLPGLETSLATLRDRGLTEDSPQVTYHRDQIARLRGDLVSA